jgi:hypothetical protein
VQGEHRLVKDDALDRCGRSDELEKTEIDFELRDRESRGIGRRVRGANDGFGHLDMRSRQEEEPGGAVDRKIASSIGFDPGDRTRFDPTRRGQKIGAGERDSTESGDTAKDFESKPEGAFAGSFGDRRTVQFHTA